jgi:thioredoxin 1
MLPTNLKHIESDEEFRKVLDENENVMVVCGRAGPMCLPVYDIQEKLQTKYPHVEFRDMSFDGPAAHNIKSLPQTRSFTGLPFTVYFKNGEVVAATTSIQNKAQVREILDREFGRAPAKAA